MACKYQRWFLSPVISSSCIPSASHRGHRGTTGRSSYRPVLMMWRSRLKTRQRLVNHHFSAFFEHIPKHCYAHLRELSHRYRVSVYPQQFRHFFPWIFPWGESLETPIFTLKQTWQTCSRNESIPGSALKRLLSHDIPRLSRLMRITFYLNKLHIANRW